MHDPSTDDATQYAPQSRVVDLLLIQTLHQRRTTRHPDRRSHSDERKKSVPRKRRGRPAEYVWVKRYVDRFEHLL